MSDRAHVQQLTRLPLSRQVSTIHLSARGWYETRVFTRIGVMLARRRAETEEQARANHDEMVAKWSANEESK